METPTRRRLFSEHEDLILLRQVNAERPFQARKGDVMKAWAKVARDLVEHEDFDRPGFDAKKAQNRFGVLMDGHVTYDSASARASGVSEDHDERILLLDELLAAFVDSKCQEKSRQEQKLSSQEMDEKDGEYIRSEAMQSLGKRKAIDDGSAKSGSGGGRLSKLTSAMQKEGRAERELREKELEFRRFQYEMELNERQKDREAATEQAQRQHETILAMLAALKKRINA